MRSDVVQAIGDLIKSGNADTAQPSYTFPKFRTDDIYPIFKKYFSVEAQKVMDIKTTNLLHQYNKKLPPSDLFKLLSKLKLNSCVGFEDGMYISCVDVVHFCASRADKITLHKAVEKVVAAVNDLVSHNYVTATLLTLSVVAVSRQENLEPEFEPEYVVISYVALTQDGHDYVEKYMPKMFVKESEMPERFENQ
jgi:hypothetical protein